VLREGEERERESMCVCLERGGGECFIVTMLDLVELVGVDLSVVLYKFNKGFKGL
jgi:hypothetical protein